MLIIGLTGGIGSGKSTVAQFFKEEGVNVVDADQKSRAVVEPGSPALFEISQHFGDDLIQADGALDRAKLRTIVFNSEQKRHWLEALLHPLFKQAIIEDLNSSTSDYAILESPLLFETDQHTMTQKNILIDVPIEVQLEGTCKRDNIEREQVEKIIAAQMSRDEKRSKADYIVDNTNTLDVVKRHILELHQRFKALAQ